MLPSHKTANQVVQFREVGSTRPRGNNRGISMDLLIASPILSSLLESAELLLSGAPESISLALWGFSLLAVGAGVRSLMAPAHRLSASPARVQYGSERRSLTESRA